jgi:hypothetical protein
MPEPKAADHQHLDTVTELSKPASGANHTHLSEISDEQLAETELVIDAPDRLQGIATEIPADYLQAHIEYTYDLRGSGREDEFVCVHGHHRHLHGAVMRLGDVRFLVGWICAENIYGESLAGRVADYDARVIRQKAVLRVRDLRTAIAGFSSWAAQVSGSGAPQAYDALRERLRRRFPFVWGTVQRSRGRMLRGALMPRYLCGDDRFEFRNSFEASFGRLMTETASVSSKLTGESQRVAASIGAIHLDIQGLVRRAELAMEKLTDVELFFQPVTLAAVCEEAENARPRRARHHAGLLRLSCRSEVIEMPSGFAIPSRVPIDRLQAALSG